MATPSNTHSLTEQSKASRAKARPTESYCDPVGATYAARETAQIARLAQTAASMAAAERKRHGRAVAPEDRADAAQDVLLHIYQWLGYPERPARLAELIDPEQPDIATAEGERVTARPLPEIVAVAGASLDKAHRSRELLDPEAGTGLVAQSASSRERGESRRSVATQLVDPSVSPVPGEVAESIAQAGIWADDPVRQAIIDTLFPDLTADDWITAGERARTPSAIRKRRQRGKGALQVDPKARSFAYALRARLEPTDAERRESTREGIAHLLAVNPHGAGSQACSLRDPAWRTKQPRIYPIRESRAA